MPAPWGVLRFLKPKGRARQQGFVYVADAEPGPFDGAGPGDSVTLPERAPPWLVVAHDIGRLTVTKWPGRLFRAEVADAVTPADEKRNGLTPPLPGAGYTRAVAVKVLEEMPAHSFFGDQGEAVAGVIDRAAQLTLSDAMALAAARNPGASEAVSRLWKSWMQQRGFPVTHPEDDWDGVLGAGPGSGSPVGPALKLISRALMDRACALCGEEVLRLDEEGGILGLQEPWGEAELALLETALALGAPDIAGADAPVLLCGWKALD